MSKGTYWLVAILSLGSSCASDSSSNEGDAAVSDTGTSTATDASGTSKVYYNVDTTGVYFSSQALGVTITGMDELGANVSYEDDGSMELLAVGEVELTGQGKHPIGVLELLANAANGSRQTLATFDLETEQVRIFHYEPADEALVIGDFDGGVFILKDGDGYVVVPSTFDSEPADEDFQMAANGYEAWQLVKAYTQLSDTSPHALLMAYALAHSAAPETRVGPECTIPDCPEGSEPASHDDAAARKEEQKKALLKDCVEGDALACDLMKKNYGLELPSSPPARAPKGQRASALTVPAAGSVCHAFRALCDCIACEAAGVGDNCDLCSP